MTQLGGAILDFYAKEVLCAGKYNKNHWKKIWIKTGSSVPYEQFTSFDVNEVSDQIFRQPGKIRLLPWSQRSLKHPDSQLILSPIQTYWSLPFQTTV